MARNQGGKQASSFSPLFVSCLVLVFMASPLIISKGYTTTYDTECHRQKVFRFFPLLLPWPLQPPSKPVQIGEVLQAGLGDQKRAAVRESPLDLLQGL